MSIFKQLSDKKIAILGWGIENQALVKNLLKSKIKCEITVCDARDEKRLGESYQRLLRRPASRNDIKWQLGKDYNKNLEKFDILLRSPGWPTDCSGIQKALRAGVELSSPMKLFFELCPNKNIIGVTGTKGKGTTASLIYEILKIAGKRVWLGGNIGIAPFEFIDKIKKNDWVVLELSSFQLEDMTASPHISVITNFYSEHLAPADPNNPNFHKSLKAYWLAKFNIAKWQSKDDYLILNSKLKNIKTDSKKIYFKKSELPSKLIGEHNKENVAAAVEVAKIVGIKQEAIKKAVAKFKGLEHRLEFVKEIKGVKYYDDSFATTPESTIIALISFTEPIVLFLGGADKGADFYGLAKEVKKRCKFVVLFNGQATARIKKELLRIKFDRNKMKLVNNIKDGVAVARTEAKFGDVVLLSTACASFGMFKNYKERGNLFKEQVKGLPR